MYDGAGDCRKLGRWTLKPFVAEGSFPVGHRIGLPF